MPADLSALVAEDSSEVVMSYDPDELGASVNGIPMEFIDDPTEPAEFASVMLGRVNVDTMTYAEFARVMPL